MPNDCVTGAPPVGYEVSYYQAGHLAEVVRGTEADYYGYTPGGKLAFEGRVEPSGSGCMDVTYYSYDGNGNITSIKHPAADPTDSALARQINYVHGTFGDDPDAIREVELVTASGTTTLIKNVDKPAFAGGYTFACITTDSCGSPRDLTYTLSTNLDGPPKSCRSATRNISLLSLPLSVRVRDG